MISLKHISEVCPGIPETLQETAEQFPLGARVIAYLRYNDQFHFYCHRVNPVGFIGSRKLASALLSTLEYLAYETSEPLSDFPLLAPDNSLVFTCFGFEIPEFIDRLREALSYQRRLPLTFYPF